MRLPPGRESTPKALHFVFASRFLASFFSASVFSLFPLFSRKKTGGKKGKTKIENGENGGTKLKITKKIFAPKGLSLTMNNAFLDASSRLYISRLGLPVSQSVLVLLSLLPCSCSHLVRLSRKGSNSLRTHRFPMYAAVDTIKKLGTYDGAKPDTCNA